MEKILAVMEHVMEKQPFQLLAELLLMHLIGIMVKQELLLQDFAQE